LEFTNKIFNKIRGFISQILALRSRRYASLNFFYRLKNCIHILTRKNATSNRFNCPICNPYFF
jgi:hypothetical protein